MKNAAARAGQARPTFHEIVLEGHPEICRGLLTGLVIGADVPDGVFFSQEAGVAEQSFGERLKEMVGLHAAVCHVIVASPVRKLLERHKKRLAAEGVRVASQKRIRSARFEFRYHAYARRYGDEIRALLRKLPSGLKLEGGKGEEKIDKSAVGVEAYTPVHDYEIKGEGAVSGRIDALIRARRVLEEHPLVTVEEIQLDLV
jgi:hypothetical protein